LAPRASIRVARRQVISGEIMRAFEGQRSDNQPVKRSTSEKEKLLRELRETLAGMKSHTSPSLRQSVQRRIAALEADLCATSSGRR
jgi:hypothetical protein